MNKVKKDWDVKYARKEPESTELKIRPDFKNYNVCLYNDKGAKDRYCWIPWYYSSKPTRRNKYYNVNCYRWKLIWLKDLK